MPFPPETLSDVELGLVCAGLPSLAVSLPQFSASAHWPHPISCLASSWLRKASAVGEHDRSLSVLQSSLICLDTPQQHPTARAQQGTAQTLSSPCSELHYRQCWALGSHPRAVGTRSMLVASVWREMGEKPPSQLPGCSRHGTHGPNTPHLEALFFLNPFEHLSHQFPPTGPGPGRPIAPKSGPGC